jgi:SEC-C motif
MRKTGRNDPCPCGSGKKYKSCCQNQPMAQPADFLWRQLRRVDDQLTHELLKHAKRLYGYEGFEAAWEVYAGDTLDAFEVDSPHNQAFFPWYLYNWRADAAEGEDDGSDTPTIAESYRERYAKRVSEMERRLIDLIANQPFSFHEVVACEPGHGYRLKDPDFSVSCFQQVWVLISRWYRVKVLCSQEVVHPYLWRLSHVRSLQRRLHLRHQGTCLGSCLRDGSQVETVGSKAIDFYALSWGIPRKPA